MARYQSCVAGVWKFREVRVEGAAVVVEESAYGAVPKRKDQLFETAAAAEADAKKREKAALAKGYARIAEAPVTYDALMAAFAPHGVEAQHGDPERARAKASAHLTRSPNDPPIEAAYTALTLAQRGCVAEARALVAEIDAHRAAAKGPKSVGFAVLLASTAFALGDRDDAAARLDAARASELPWSGPEAWWRYMSSQGVEAPALMLDLGREEAGRALFVEIGWLSLDTLFQRRRADLIDEVMPQLAASKSHSASWYRYRFKRARLDGPERFNAEFVAVASAPVVVATAYDDLHVRLSALAVAALESVTGGHPPPPAEPLRALVAKTFDDLPYMLAYHELWIAVAALTKLGVDISHLLDRISSPAHRLRAVLTVFMHSEGATRARLLDMARDLSASPDKLDAAELASMLLSLAPHGVTLDDAGVRALAARAGKAAWTVGYLAALAIVRGDRELARTLLLAVKKNDLSNAASSARRMLAHAGALEGYAWLCRTLPPWGEIDALEDALALVRARDRDNTR